MVSREDDSTDVVSRARQALADYTSRLGQRVPAAGLIAELADEVERLTAESAFARDEVHLRPMTEVESNLMTEVLDLRRRVGVIRRLHQQYRPAFDHPDVCSHCTRGMDLVDWPCPTIEAVD